MAGGSPANFLCKVSPASPSEALHLDTQSYRHPSRKRLYINKCPYINTPRPALVSHPPLPTLPEHDELQLHRCARISLAVLTTADTSPNSAPPRAAQAGPLHRVPVPLCPNRVDMRPLYCALRSQRKYVLVPLLRLSRHLLTPGAVLHLGQAIYTRLWFMLPTAVLANFAEVLGWSARLWSSKNPPLLDPFLMQCVLPAGHLRLPAHHILLPVIFYP